MVSRTFVFVSQKCWSLDILSAYSVEELFTAFRYNRIDGVQPPPYIQQLMGRGTNRIDGVQSCKY